MSPIKSKCDANLTLNSYSSCSEKLPVEGALGEPQLNWLGEELRSHAQQPTVLFVHHPPFDVGSAWVDALGLKDAESLLQIVTSSTQVKAICAGHVHQECEERIGDLQAA